VKAVLHIACGAVLLAAASAALAAPSPAQLRFQRERADCLSGASNQDRATCLKEATAALREARAGNLSSGDLARNRVQRCDALPAPDRDDCVLRMQAGTTSGTARDGGIIRELERPVPSK
jgi:hypothetical protein